MKLEYRDVGPELGIRDAFGCEYHLNVLYKILKGLITIVRKEKKQN